MLAGFIRLERPIMKAAPVLSEEMARLSALHAVALLARPDEYPIDYVTHIGAQLSEVPIHMLSLVDADRHWFTSCVGLDIAQSARETSFCVYAVATGGALDIEDTLRDWRFADNPMVTAPPHVRFHAGHPTPREALHTLFDRADMALQSARSLGCNHACFGDCGERAARAVY
jgi:GAF domain-containing protein